MRSGEQGMRSTKQVPLPSHPAPALTCQRQDAPMPPPRRRTRPAGSWGAHGGQGAHGQRHHPLREGQLRPGGRRRAERQRARPAAGALPPAPRCLPRAARRGSGPHRAQQPGRHKRPQQPAGPLLPLQCRQARCCLPTQEGSTDFRGLQASYARRETGCVFCPLEGSGRVLLENAFEAVHRRC